MADEITALQEQVKTLFNTTNELRQDLKDLQEKTNKCLEGLRCDISKLSDKFSNRLPVWATMFISVLTAMVGVLMGILCVGG